MVVLGVDAHKRSHTIVAVNDNGQQVESTTVPATPAGHEIVIGWARSRWADAEVMWAVEDCRDFSRGLETALLAAGLVVVRVPPWMTAQLRRGVRTPGKSDPIDALAVARAALQEPDLPRARLDGIEREIRLLVDRREDLVQERTRAQNRLLGHLHELDPGNQPGAGSLKLTKTLNELDARLENHDGIVAELARDLVDDIRALTARINAYERRLAAAVTPLVPTLLALHGCGVLTAAKILGEIGSIDRFRTKAGFARFNGTAPIPVWSANPGRHRLNRGGNRQVNAALHRIVITQLQRPGPARTYIERRISQGKTRTEAIRCLRRHVSNDVYRRLLDDHHHAAQPLAA